MLEAKGILSAGKLLRHISIHYCFIKDLVESGEVVVEFFGTKFMVTDFNTKLLQAKLFPEFKDLILGRIQ